MLAWLIFPVCVLSGFPLSSHEEMYVTSSPKCLQPNLGKTEFSPQLNSLETRGVKLTRGFPSLPVNMAAGTNSLVEPAVNSGLLELLASAAPWDRGRKRAQEGRQVPLSSRISRLEDWPTSIYLIFLHSKKW